ncbi:CPBP family intramembrane metalloprotease [Erythrobacter arachoides]|uniref:CPBP family intramembrane metalloprotease n=1 Tax=Aurantiacibacter arachoides TaxID=1850444 RepID=A0A845A9C7_9SPHN|nr:CPBP family intramembrane glutamic endopeptidase [Aurantiacibacter arachoides]MXO94179.1 CPBP family intramembrane metalloprotease [Aurantiacibacter arachoides]GGD65481.1 hypothetical protein GCM10011411_27280 [Aurantiacibacter arachoides]
MDDRHDPRHPAAVFDEDAPAPGKAPARPGTLGWFWFLAQVITVVLAYLVGSTLPTIPAIIDAMQNGTSPEDALTSAAAALSTMAGMAAALLVCWLWLRGEGRVGQVFGLGTPPPGGWRRTLVWAAGATVAIIAIFTVGAPLVEAIGLPTPDASFVLDLVTESPAMFALWIVGVAWLAAGLGEELLYRGFLMDRLQRLSGIGGSTAAVLIIQAVLFGLPHLYQGWGGTILTGSIGLLLGWVRLRFGGNLWACVLAHAAVDTIMMALAYGEKLGWVTF